MVGVLICASAPSVFIWVSFSYLPHPPLWFLPFSSPTPLLKYRQGVCNFGLNEVTLAHVVWSFCYLLLHTLQRACGCPLHPPGLEYCSEILCAMFWMLHESANKCIALLKFTVHCAL